MADDTTTTSLDELLGLASEDDGALEAGATAPAGPVSIEEFLATYDELGTAEDAAPTDDAEEEALELAEPDRAGDGVAPSDVADVGADRDVDDVVGAEAGDDVDLLTLVATTAVKLRAAAAARDAEAAAAAEPPEPVADRQPPALPTSVGDAFTATASAAHPAPSLLLQYPSRDFPPPPVVRLEVPPGWLGSAPPDCEMAARGPEQIDGMYPTVVVRVRRIAAAAARDGSGADWSGLPPDDDAEILGDELRSDATAPARRMLVRRTASDGRISLTCHLFVYVPATEHVSSVVAISATWPESGGAELAQQLTDVITSVRIFLPQRGR